MSVQLSGLDIDLNFRLEILLRRTGYCTQNAWSFVAEISDRRLLLVVAAHIKIRRRILGSTDTAVVLAGNKYNNLVETTNTAVLDVSSSGR